MKKEKTIIEKLYDSFDSSNIVLYDACGNPVEFSQIALVNYCHLDYAILAPVIKMEDEDDDTMYVFAIEEIGDDEFTINIEHDQEVIDAVFDIYDKLEKEHK